MKFLTTIKDSIYNPGFYQRLSEMRIRKSIRYYYTLVIILSVVSVIPFIPGFSAFLASDVFNAFANQYPQNLEVKISNGIVSTNVQEPYILKYQNNTATTNALVIDTKSDFSPAQFEAYKTNIILKKDFVAISDAQKQIKMYPLTNVKNLTINAANVHTWLESLRGILKALTPVFIILIYIAFIVVYSAKLVYLFLIALLVMLITYLAKKPRSYMKSYQIGLHAMTFGLLLQVFLSFMHVRAPNFSYTLILLVVVVINILHIPTEQSTLPAEKIENNL